MVIIYYSQITVFNHFMANILDLDFKNTSQWRLLDLTAEVGSYEAKTVCRGTFCFSQLNKLLH